MNETTSAASAPLLMPYTVRGITLKNKIVVSPMCQYCAVDGMADDWHLVHLGSRAAGGAGLIFTEAQAVTAQGRISPGDLGLWKDEQIAPLKRITQFIKRMGSVAGIQLAHAGRKGSCYPPFKGRGKPLADNEGAWEIVAPSPIKFSDISVVPHELSKKEIEEIMQAFISAAKRAIEAGFEIIEIHAAHGYLINSFLSPLSNHRTDNYGGSFENRIRFLIELVRKMRRTIPEDMPLFVRISATDWAESGGWDIDQSIELCKRLKDEQVDLIDVSSGGILSNAVIPVTPGYQVPFAAKIKKEAGIATGAVGKITEAKQANEILECQSADLIFIAREMLRCPYFAIHAEKELDQEQDWPLQYGYAVKRP